MKKMSFLPQFCDMIRFQKTSKIQIYIMKIENLKISCLLPIFTVNNNNNTAILK